MKIFENYNTATQKYGIEFVNKLTKLGIPPKYLLSACRFVSNDGVPLERVVCMFKEWIRYVAKYNNIDVNKLSYEQFYKTIANEKQKHCIPNVIFSNDTASIGVLNSAKDVQKISTKNQWCIKGKEWFNRYSAKGYKFYVIYIPTQPMPFTYVIAAIHNGNVEYYNSNDMQQCEPLVDDYGENEHEKYQALLPSEIKQILYNTAAEQTEEREQQITTENKQTRNTKKNTIKLNEAQLRNIIKESVKNTLREWDESLYDDATEPFENEFANLISMLNKLGISTPELGSLEPIPYLREVFNCIATIDNEDNVDKAPLYEIMRSAVYQERKRMTREIDKLAKFADRMCEKYQH